MTHRSCLIVLACSFLLFPFVIQAQETTAAEKSEENPGQSKENKAFGLIGSVAAGAAMLRVPENRIRVTATVADLLWSPGRVPGPSRSGPEVSKIDSRACFRWWGTPSLRRF